MSEVKKQKKTVSQVIAELQKMPGDAILDIDTCCGCSSVTLYVNGGDLEVNVPYD